MTTPRSLKIRLLRNLMMPLFLAWALSILMGFVLTQRTLNKQQDSRLEQIAESLSQVVTSRETTVTVTESGGEAARGGTHVVFQIWRNDKTVSYSLHAPKESLSDNEGYSENDVASKTWRVFAARSPYARILVGEDLAERKALIHGMILSTLWPMVIIFPLIALILWLSVGSGLKPLSDLATAIETRTPQQLAHVDLEAVPSEVTPVVRALNTLLDVVDRALDRERQFTDNAAHELKTPLAGIKTQAQVALRATDERERQESLLAVSTGVDRAAQVVSQLLTLARLNPETVRVSFLAVDLNDLVSQVISKFTPQALAKQIDLGLAESDPVLISGDRPLLELLLSNLIDNAIRYTPPRGVIDIRIQKSGSAVVLTIEDTGAGIPEQDRKRVFDRFVRLAGGETEGSGIGLAIARKISDLHHCVIELDSPKAHLGLVVRVTFK